MIYRGFRWTWNPTPWMGGGDVIATLPPRLTPFARFWASEQNMLKTTAEKRWALAYENLQSIVGSVLDANVRYPAYDAIPWEIHAIKNTSAYKAAVEAYHESQP